MRKGNTLSPYGLCRTDKEQKFQLAKVFMLITGKLTERLKENHEEKRIVNHQLDILIPQATH
jgi:hypothetical protein